MIPAAESAQANATGQGAAYSASIAGPRCGCVRAYAGAVSDVYSSSTYAATTNPTPTFRIAIGSISTTAGRFTARKNQRAGQGVVATYHDCAYKEVLAKRMKFLTEISPTLDSFDYQVCNEETKKSGNDGCGSPDYTRYYRMT